MNQVERWFGLLTDKLIRRGVHTSVQALENDIREWIATWNDNPRPFTWTKTADEILELPRRLPRQRDRPPARLTNEFQTRDTSALATNVHRVG